MVLSPRLLVLGTAVLAVLAGACGAPPVTTSPPRAPRANAARPQEVALEAPDEKVPDQAYSAARLAAAAALGRRDFREAERLLAAEVERTGESDWLLGDLAQVRALSLLAAKAPGSAAFDLTITALDRAIARQPKSPRLFALRGAVAAKEKRYADARADFGRALELEPADARLRLDSADLAAAFRDFGTADTEYRAAISHGGGDFDTWLARAIALRARIDEGADDRWEERYRAARDALAAAMNQDPSRIEVQYHFAVLLLDHGIKRGGPGGEVTLLLVRDLLRRFIDAAASRPALAGELARAKQLYSDIDNTTRCDFGRTEAERKAAEAEAKQRAAEAEALDAPEGSP
jgi:tetratricopeptide (TPR) repeat protein